MDTSEMHSSNMEEGLSALKADTGVSVPSNCLQVRSIEMFSNA